MKTVFLICWLLLCTQSIVSQEFAGHTHDILRVKFNPEATQLISYSAGDGWLCLWDVKSQRLLWRSKTEFIQKGDEYYTLTSFAFSPDQSLIASGSGNGSVQLWNAKTGEFLWRSDAHPEDVTIVAFSPDGKTIVTAASPDEDEDEIKVLRVDDGQIIKKLSGKSCTVVALAFDPTGKTLRTGNLDGNVSEWNLETGQQNASVVPVCQTRRTYEWEISFTPDLLHAAKRTGETEFSLLDTQTNTVTKKLVAKGWRIYSRLSADGNKLIVSGYGGFTFYDLMQGATRHIDEFSRTGSTIDLSLDGSLFAEGGSWGDAAIKVTETQKGKSWLLGKRGNKQLAPAYQPNAVALQLAQARKQKQALLREAQLRRDRQAAIDIADFQKQVYITFEHYGDMTDPGQQRIMETGTPDKSKVAKSAQDASAVWLRLHNDSPLPVKIPTQSIYLPKPDCFHQFSKVRKMLGLCDGREISLWHGLEDKKGKAIPYGFDVGSEAILLPKTSVLFALPLEILKDGNAMLFGFTFQQETDENRVEDYGTAIMLRFRASDLPKDNGKAKN